VLFTLIISVLILPAWAKLVPWSISLINFSAFEWVIGFLILFVIACAIGFAAGLYPALMLTGDNFQNLLKGAFKVSKKGILLRKSMLVCQLVISISLLCSVLIISKQMDYLKKIDIGYVKNELLLIHMPGTEVAQKFELLRNKLSQNSNVTS